MPASRNGPTRSDTTLSRSTSVTVVVLLLALSLGGLVWYLAYAADESPPQNSPVVHLQDSVTIGWGENGISSIEARTLPDTYAALGYVHGMRRTWSVVLWRQTALGTLSEWFGPGTLPIDRHARRLDLARQARAAFDALPSEEQALLNAYASGLNAAFDAGAAQRHDELVVLDLAPDPWQPWHTLAVERLFGWLATTPPPDSLPASLRQADMRFRRWLHLQGFDHSTAWAVAEGDSAFLLQQHVFGTSALPLFESVTITRPNAPPLQAASLPGTPFLPAGKRGSQAWALLLDSRTHHSLVDTAAVNRTSSFHRLQTRSGDEELLRVKRTPSGLPFSYPEADSMSLLLEWPGFRPISDAPAWHHLLEGNTDEATFQLMAGSGLTIGRDGWQLIGEPDVTERLPNGLFIGRSNWAHYQAEVVRSKLQRTPASDLVAAGRSDSSAWATRQTNRLLPSIRPLAGTDPLLTDAATYLRNWDFRYDPSSIGASVLDAWLAHHDAPLTPLLADSLFRSEMYRHSFKRAVQSLANRFGADARQWRWERISPNDRYFPVWSADSLVAQDLSALATTRYAPIRRSAPGHPSAPAGGVSLTQPMPTPAAWRGWTHNQRQEPLTVHQVHLRPDAFMSRYTAPDRPPAPAPLSTVQDPEWTTRLVPANTSR